jgi:hypothetical protein
MRVRGVGKALLSTLASGRALLAARYSVRFCFALLVAQR